MGAGGPAISTRAARVASRVLHVGCSIPMAGPTTATTVPIASEELELCCAQHGARVLVGIANTCRPAVAVSTGTARTAP